MKLAENSKPTKFIKLDNDHYGTGTGVTLIRKDAFSEIAWNASDSNGYKNRYFGCTLDNFCDGIWPLKLDEKIRECLVPVPIVVAEGNQVATLHTIYRKGFAISCTEAGVSGWQTEGKAFSYFSDNAKRIAYLDETATAVYWGLRSPYSYGNLAYSVITGGTVIVPGGEAGLTASTPTAPWATATCTTPTSRRVPLLILNLLSLYLTAQTAMDATRLRACRATTAGCM